MTSKTSFFNFGIYKMTLRRFFWGSVAYFVLLFLTCVFPVLLDLEDIKNYGWEEILSSNGAYLFSVLIAIVVPIVMSLLIFRCIHEKKQNVFIGSMPVNRVPFFCSSILAGYTLMAISVFLNGIILLIASLYLSPVMPATHCFNWILINLFVLFLMYGYAVLAVALTGNSFMAVFFYAFLHFLPLIVTGLISSVGYRLIDGFPQESEMVRAVLNSFPTNWPTYFCDWFTTGHLTTVLVYSLVVIVFYIGAGVFFYVRKSERTGDVVMFQCMNPILKYFLTFCAAWLMFLTCSTTYDEVGNILLNLLITLFVTAFVYFSCEMILKKSVRVFHKYKGYFGFLVITVVGFLTIGLTGFFGYRDYVPEIDQIQSASIIDSSTRHEYSDFSIPASRKPEAVEFVINTHKKHIAMQHTVLKGYKFKDMLIRYTLNNGRVVERYYHVDMKTVRDYERTLYQFDDYKKGYNSVLRIDPETIHDLSVHVGNRQIGLEQKQEILSFMQVYQEESATLSFDQTVEVGGDSVWYKLDLNGPDEVRLGFQTISSLYSMDSDLKFVVTEITNSYPKTIAWIEAYRERQEALLQE